MKIQQFLAHLTLSVLFTVPAMAAPNSQAIKAAIESQNSCDSFIRFDNVNAYLGSGRYLANFDSDKPRPSLPGTVQVAPLDGSAAFTLHTSDAPIDMVTDANLAYILTYSSIELWDLNKRSVITTFPTTTAQQPLEYKQHAQAMVRYGNKLVIAHGRLGVSIFDMQSKTITNEIPLLQAQLPQESMATGIAIEGHSVYILMDSFTLNGPDSNPAFRGFVIIDMNTEKVTSQLNGLDPGASSLASYGNKMIVSFYGSPIWMFDATKMKSWPHPQADIFKFPFPGHVEGSAAMDDQYYYTCFEKPPASIPGYGTYVPMVFDRKVLAIGDDTTKVAPKRR